MSTRGGGRLGSRAVTASMRTKLGPELCGDLDRHRPICADFHSGSRCKHGQNCAAQHVDPDGTLLNEGNLAHCHLDHSLGTISPSPPIQQAMRLADETAGRPPCLLGGAKGLTFRGERYLVLHLCQQHAPERGAGELALAVGGASARGGARLTAMDPQPTDSDLKLVPMDAESALGLLFGDRRAPTGNWARNLNAVRGMPLVPEEGTWLKVSVLERSVGWLGRDETASGSYLIARFHGAYCRSDSETARKATKLNPGCVLYNKNSYHYADAASVTNVALVMPSRLLEAKLANELERQGYSPAYAQAMDLAWRATSRDLAVATSPPWSASQLLGAGAPVQLSPSGVWAAAPDSPDPPPERPDGPPDPAAPAHVWDHRAGRVEAALRGRGGSAAAGPSGQQAGVGPHRQGRPAQDGARPRAYRSRSRDGWHMHL